MGAGAAVADYGSPGAAVDAAYTALADQLRALRPEVPA